MIANTNAGTASPPAFRSYMNLMALDSLPANSAGPRAANFEDSLRQIKTSGFRGVQFASPASAEQLKQCRELSLGIASSGRVNTPQEAEELAARFAAQGFECATLHVGWGLEDDTEAHHLIEAVIDASGRHRIPLYVETHRATIFQDMWRAVQFVKRFPEIRFNGDFSHWYTGLEMVYGGFDKKFEFIRPILERVRFIHGRIGNPGCIQVRVEEDAATEATYVSHFRRLWTACFEQFLQSAKPGDYICFTPELLAPEIYYARMFRNASGTFEEESDRWTQSLLLKRIAEECFRVAAARLDTASVPS